jgi:hypothetical protein
MKIPETELKQIIMEELGALLQELDLSAGVDAALAPFRWLRSMAGGTIVWGRLIKLAYQASERDRVLIVKVMDKMSQLVVPLKDHPDYPKNIQDTAPFWGQAIDALWNLSAEERTTVIDAGVYVFGVDEESLFAHTWAAGGFSLADIEELPSS